MLAIATLFIVVLASLIVTRVATVALTLTGLSREAARFQARSALSGVGFTTSEAETVVGHPVRRRIVMLLMLLGSAGIVTAIATLSVSFVGADGRATAIRLVVLVLGLALVWRAATSTLVDRALTRLIERALRRWTVLDVRDYAELLHLGHGYAVGEVAVAAGEWLADKTLSQLGLRDEGVAVLGIERADGTFVGSPVGGTRVDAGDTLLLYGRRAQLEELDARPAGSAGDAAHTAAVARRGAAAAPPAAEP